jgi:ornithine cyclodeaminase/alanine dehydrogenase-like protein (mu-crystallin family)
MPAESAETPTLLLDGAAVRSVLTWPDTIAAIESAFVAAAEGNALPGTASQLTPPGALLHLKAGGFSEPPLLTIKANLRPDDARAFGVLLVFDHRRRSLRAILDSADVTAVRTAATAAVAAKALGGRDGATVAVIGSGPVAERILEALPHVLAPGQLRLWSRDRSRATALSRLAPIGVDHKVCETPAEAVAAADIVVTCTPSREPLLTAGDLARHALILAMGADSPGKQELAADVLTGATVVADDPAAARRVGESARLPESAADPVHLGAVLARGELQRADARVVFDSVGTAFTDTAATEVIVRLATERGLGVPFTFLNSVTDQG